MTKLDWSKAKMAGRPTLSILDERKREKALALKHKRASKRRRRRGGK